MSKLDTAVEIAKANPDKKTALQAIQEDLGVTRANASVYLHKAYKLIGTAPSTPPATKIEKPVEVKPAVVRDFNESQTAEYTTAMAERTLQGLSTMSIDEYFDMMDNLKELV